MQNLTRIFAMSDKKTALSRLGKPYTRVRTVIFAKHILFVPSARLELEIFESF